MYLRNNMAFPAQEGMSKLTASKQANFSLIFGSQIRTPLETNNFNCEKLASQNKQEQL